MANMDSWIKCSLHLTKTLAVLVLCCLVSACSLFQGQPGTHPVTIGPGSPLTGASSVTVPSGQSSDYGWLLPAGSYHMVTLRSLQAGPSKGQQILCTEPSPDWAVAFGEALQLSAEGKAPSGIGASLSGSSSATENITALVGRTAGVVALRDGLYSACQAYANNIIGKDAYALILSQYGDLLVDLAGTASGGSGTAGATTTTTATPATPAGVAVAVSTGGSNGASAPATASKGATSSSPSDPQVALMQQEILQGLITTCITNSDPTEKPPDDDGTKGGTVVEDTENVLLSTPVENQKGTGTTTYCQQLIQNVVDASSNLLKPQSNPTGGTPNAAAPGGKGAPVADPAILALQIQLNKEGAGLVEDGVYGQKTKAAILKYPNVF
jgi:hypothetical protein